MKICEYVDQCINSLGIEKVFGIPGSLVMPIWQSITKAEIVLCSHEQEASYLATGYAKMSKKPVAVITTGGPGVTNCISGVASANIDSIPMIYISGRTSISEDGKGVRQEESHYNRMYDSADVLKAFTKKSVCVESIKTAKKTIMDAFFESISERNGAVHLSIPIDIQKSEICIDDDNSRRILEAKTSKVFTIDEKPLFIIGWGAWLGDCITDIYSLAEKVNAPVLVTSKAYCCINERTRTYLGKLGYGYHELYDDFIEWYNPTSVIAFGTSLGKKDLCGSIIQKYMAYIDVYLVSNEIICREKNVNYHEILCGDLGEFIKILSDNTVLRGDNNILYNKILSTREQVKNAWVDMVDVEDNMARCINILNKGKNDNVVFTADAGNHLANAAVLINPETIGTLFLDVGLRAMGTGICSAVGMAIADSAKTYVAITGDGCMMMNGNVMHVAKERNLPIVFIVFNNTSLGRVRVGQSIMNDYRATDIMNVDFQSYGKTFGLVTYQYDDLDKFERDIFEIIGKRETCLIEIKTGNDEVPIIVKGNIT